MPASIFSRIAQGIRAAWILLGVCLLTLVIAEIAGKIAYKVVDAASFAIHHRKPPAPTPCERVMASLELRWQPYTYWRGKPSHNDLVTVGADGRRATWQSPRAGADAPVVAVTGGSAVWGMCVRDDETIPSCLARQLAGANTTARVENHAQIGWVTTQSLLDLMLDLRAGRVPRVVVFYEGWNDIVAGLSEGAPGAPLNEENREAEFNLLKHVGRMRLYSIGRPFDSALGRLANAIRRHLFHPRPPSSVSPGWRKVFGADTSAATLDRVAREVVRVYVWNLAEAEALGRAYGFRPLFYWQPDIVGKTTLAGVERATRAENPLMVRFATRVRELVKSAPELAGRADFRDLETTFDGDEQEIFYDWCHVTAGANDRVASTIADDVRRALAKPAAASPTTRSSVAAPGGR
jgi:hypothetical protein